MHTHKHVHVHFDIRPHDVRTAYPHSAVSSLSLRTLFTGAASAGEEDFPTAQDTGHRSTVRCASHHRLVVGSPHHGFLRHGCTRSGCRLGLPPLLHHFPEAITGGTLGLQREHLLHELVVGTICVGLGLCVLLRLQARLVCIAALLKICPHVHFLGWTLASKCATCAPGRVLPLGLLWRAVCVRGGPYAGTRAQRLPETWAAGQLQLDLEQVCPWWVC